MGGSANEKDGRMKPTETALDTAAGEEAVQTDTDGHTVDVDGVRRIVIHPAMERGTQ
jgi:hypothetical protein